MKAVASALLCIAHLPYLDGLSEFTISAGLLGCTLAWAQQDDCRACPTGEAGVQLLALHQDKVCKHRTQLGA